MASAASRNSTGNAGRRGKACGIFMTLQKAQIFRHDSIFGRFCNGANAARQCLDAWLPGRGEAAMIRNSYGGVRFLRRCEVELSLYVFAPVVILPV